MLLVGGGISAGRHVVASTQFAEPGWWQAQAASFDLGSHRLLAIDWIGADGELNLPIDAADQADATAALLDHLGIATADGFIGASYGGMVALQFAARHRARMAPFSSSARPAQPTRSQAPAARSSGAPCRSAMSWLAWRSPAPWRC